ncbi:hypothetical protein F4861DRAFT_544459 [Xylaria intraflava]|nr:hypothetical protein F4861DRAFT_544459 [Xylaria intraflava]
MTTRLRQKRAIILSSDDEAEKTTDNKDDEAHTDSSISSLDEAVTHINNVPRHVEMSGKQIHQYLKLYDKENSVNQPYIHKFLIFFPDDADKRSWSNVQMRDLAKWRHTFNSFLNSKYQNKKVKLGFFSVLTGLSIGNAWKKAPWHYYLIAIIARANNPNNIGSKFAMILWEYDPVETMEKKISN